MCAAGPGDKYDIHTTMYTYLLIRYKVGVSENWALYTLHISSHQNKKALTPFYHKIYF